MLIYRNLGLGALFDESSEHMKLTKPNQLQNGELLEKRGNVITSSQTKNETNAVMLSSLYNLCPIATPTSHQRQRYNN